MILVIRVNTRSMCTLCSGEVKMSLCLTKYPAMLTYHVLN